MMENLTGEIGAKNMIDEVLYTLEGNKYRSNKLKLPRCPLHFEGVFVSTGGNEIILQTDSSGCGVGRFTKLGTCMGSVATGDEFCRNMVRVNENTWKGLVREKNGGTRNFLYYGSIIIHENGDLLTAIPNNAENYSFNRVGLKTQL